MLRKNTIKIEFHLLTYKDMDTIVKNYNDKNKNKEDNILIEDY